MKNFNQKNNFESEIDEQKIGANITREIEGVTTLRGSALEGAFRDMELAIGLKNNPILLKDVKTGGIAELRTADEIFAALKDGKLVGKELGRVEKGLLKSTSTSPGLRKSISVDFAKDKNVLSELAANNRNTTAEIKGYLKSKGYPPESVNEIVAQMKANGAIDAKGVLSKNAAANAGKAGSKTAGKSIFTKAKELVTNIKIKKMSWKQLLVWGSGIGISAIALWYYVKQYSDVIPDGMPTTPPSQDWGPCLGDLLSLKKAKIAKSPKGEISVYTPPTEKYPGGLNFYAPGRVMNAKTGEMGTWKCVAGKAQTNENMNKTQVNESIGQIVKRVLNEKYLMEQLDTQVDRDVNKMIDYLDFPVTQSDLQKALNLLKQYSTSPKVKDFLHYYEKSGIVNTSLSTTLSMIYTTEPGSVRLKEQLITLLDQIESGKVVPSTSISVQPNTTQRRPQETIINEQNNLSIVWDKDKKPGGDGGSTGGGNTGGGTTTKKTYYDCTNVNIDTTPLTYGCKSPKIAEIQKCLGVGVDGKFGPNTRKALIGKSYDVSNGITKDIYTKVLAACNPSASQTAGSTEGGADVKYLRTPIKLNSVDLPKIPSANTSSSASGTQGMTGEEYYTSLKDQGLINVMNFLGRRKVAYNGPVLGQSDIQRLNDFLEGRSYYQTNDDKYKLTDAGEKYVWIQQ